MKVDLEKVNWEEFYPRVENFPFPEIAHELLLSSQIDDGQLEIPF